jgi:hypothetical protein
MKRKIESLGKYAGIFMVIISMIILIGCGGGGGGSSSSTPPATPPSGTVVQGGVSKAVVFADHLTGAEANFKIDADEASTATTTAADGTFTLAAIPAYSYIIVSQGGVDSITGKPAMQMLASAGVGVVSPLTTLVALNPAAASVIASLGVSYTTDISQSVTPASLLLVQSIQAISTIMAQATDPAGNILTNDQSNDIQMKIMQQIANQIAGQTAAQLTNTTTLTTTLQTAVTNALNIIKADPANSNVSIPNTTTLANSVVTPGLINSIGSIVSPGGSFSTTSTSTEASIITPANATTINTTTTNTSNTAAGNVTSTPKPFTPPTISGTPATSVLVGASYSFSPAIADADGNSLTCSIVNKPAWAVFNSANGQLSGTPAATDVGTTSGIVISVTDGVTTASLPVFGIIVSTAPVQYIPPTISGTPATSVLAGASYSFIPTATGSSLTFSMVNTPAWAIFSTTTGQLSGTPTAANVGTTSGIVISVTDGITTVSLPAFSLTVSLAYTPPTISGTPAGTVQAGASYSFIPTVTGNSLTSLTFSIVNTPTWAAFNTTTGQLSGTPATANVGTTSGIVISVTDGVTTVSLPAFSITVSAVYTPPTISGTPATSVSVGASYSFIPSATGSNLTFSVVNKPAWAVFSATTGQLSGTPAPANVGTTSGIVISVTDGITPVSLPAFSITVPSYTPPTISGTPATSVFVGASYSFIPTATGSNLTFSIVNKPAWAAFSATTGQLSGTPATANVGTTSGIVISVTDGITPVSLSTFSITVSPVTGSGGGT